jgi:hypothetical protein
MAEPIRMGRVSHLVTVPVHLGESIEAQFVLDTGIGVNLISRELAAKVGTRPTGEVSKGRRMSGQEISSPIEILPHMQLGDHVWNDVQVSPLEMSSFHPILRDLGGFLSLGLFESVPFTADHPNGVLQLHEHGGTSFRETPGYVEVPLQIMREGSGVSVQVDVQLPNGERARMEVDSGSDSLVLHQRYMEALGVALESPTLKTVRGQDETGHPYLRYFSPLKGEFRLAEAPTVLQKNPDVMFQEIIHDGLLGIDFLQRFPVTFDLQRSRIGFVTSTD